jgi:GntR family transcriptional repressor for pyruvate dehydrogenase complex
MLGVSRVSVRETVSALEAVGLVDVRHGRGSFVISRRPESYSGLFGPWLEAHRDEVMHLLDVRGALDELAAGEAGPDEIAAIGGAHESFAAAASDPRKVVHILEQLDIKFHESLADAGAIHFLRTS